MQTAVRAEVCPLLRPSLLADMLVGYKADMFDAEPVPPKLREELRALDIRFVATERTFEPEVAPLLPPTPPSAV